MKKFTIDDLSLEYLDADKRQKLPTREEWIEIFDAVQKKDDARLLIMDRLVWHNAITKTEDPVYNVPLLALRRFDKPVMVSYIEKFQRGSSKATQSWTFADRYHHINISGSRSTVEFINSEIRYVLYYQSICSPIVTGDVFRLDKKHIIPLIKLQLSGQNTGSPFQNITSISNAWTIVALKDENSTIIPPNAPVIQLLTRKSIKYIRENLAVIQNMIYNDIPITHSDDYVLRKDNNTSYYSLCTKEELAEKPETLYPIITHEQIRDMLDNIPKQEVDVICCGLGSAGTGILDQLGRGTYCKTYVLIDPDTIEDKNLRNQWYTSNDIGANKVNRSASKLKEIAPAQSNINVMTYSRKFQDAGNLQSFTCKYLISGFDSIKARLELLEMVENGDLEAEYLIDTRYDDLTASIFFIDTSNSEEMRRYRTGLEADYKAFVERDKQAKKETHIQNEEQFWEWFNSLAPLGACEECLIKMGYLTQEDIEQNTEKLKCPLYTDPNNPPCGSEACKAQNLAIYNEYKEHIADNIMKVGAAVAESSCIRQNFIDIYKYASTFVFSAIREIESGNAKPFTHVEAQTDKFPAHMVIGK